MQKQWNSSQPLKKKAVQSFVNNMNEAEELQGLRNAGKGWEKKWGVVNYNVNILVMQMIF